MAPPAQAPTLQTMEKASCTRRRRIRSLKKLSQLRGSWPAGRAGEGREKEEEDCGLEPSLEAVVSDAALTDFCAAEARLLLGRTNNLTVGTR